MQVQTPASWRQERKAGKVPPVGFGLWTYPLCAQAFCPQLGKWNHVTGCGLAPVLHQLCTPVSGRATTRLVGLSPAA